MRQRYGPLYGRAVLRPIAEQLLDIAAVRSGGSACDLLCDRGAATRLLASAVAPGGAVFAVDLEPSLAEGAASEAAPAPCVVTAVVARDAALPLPDGSCDAVISVLTIASAPDLVGEAVRIVARDGRIAIAAWDAERPPPHEAALEEALHTVAGHKSDPLQALLAPVGDGAGLARGRIREVARFDGPGHLWSALADERAVGDDIAGLAPAVVEGVRQETLRLLAPFAQRDGTLRIPVEALLLYRP